MFTLIFIKIDGTCTVICIWSLISLDRSHNAHIVEMKISLCPSTISIEVTFTDKLNSSLILDIFFFLTMMYCKLSTVGRTVSSLWDWRRSFDAFSSFESVLGKIKNALKFTSPGDLTIYSVCMYFDM